MCCIKVKTCWSRILNIQIALFKVKEKLRHFICLWTICLQSVYLKFHLPYLLYYKTLTPKLVIWSHFGMMVLPHAKISSQKY